MQQPSSILPSPDGTSLPAAESPVALPAPEAETLILRRLVDGYFTTAGATGVLVTVAPASLVIGTSYQLGSPWVLLWAALIAAVGTLWMAMAAAYRRPGSANTPPAAWERRIFAISLAFGVVYGSAPLGLIVPGDAPQNGLVVIYILMAIAVAAACNFWVWRAALGACSLMGFPLAAWLLLQGEGIYLLLGVALVYFTGLQLVLACQANRLQVQSLERLIANEHLARRLDDQVRLAVHATRHAEQASMEKSRFLAAANHDLRQPLHAVAILADILHRQLGSGSHGPQVQHLVHSVSELTTSLDAMLDISRIDSGAVQANPRPVVVADLFLAMHRRFVDRANAKNLALRVAQHGEVILADPDLVARLLSNLIDNALKYTERGGVLVSARRRGGAERPGVLIEVRDSGIGIPPTQQAHVFEEFYQVHNSGRDRHHGLGLGLSIVRRLASLMHMPLHLRSAPGCGSCFSFLCREAPRGESVRALALRAAPDFARADNVLAGRMVLVADNEPAVLAGLSQLLALSGATVRTALSAAEAVAAAEACARLDVAILDYRLGDDGTGLELARRLRGIARHARVPVMIVTGDTHTVELSQLRMPDLEVLFKPLSGSAIVDAVARCVGAGSLPGN